MSEQQQQHATQFQEQDKTTQEINEVNKRPRGRPKTINAEQQASILPHIETRARGRPRKYDTQELTKDTREKLTPDELTQIRRRNALIWKHNNYQKWYANHQKFVENNRTRINEQSLARYYRKKEINTIAIAV